MHQATTTATNEWNGATNSAGEVVPYFFNIVSDEIQADIKIVPGSTTFGCANYNRATQEMRIDSSAADNTAASIADLIAHELGHPLGLRNSSEVSSGATVMQGFSGDCDMVTDEIRPNDVDQVIRQATDKTTCTATVQVGEELEPPPTPTPTPPSSCPDVCSTPQAYFPATCFGPVDWCLHPDTGCESGLEANGRCCCSITSTPIVIDVLGNGFDLTSFEDGINFDLNASGIAAATSWTSANSDDALLVLDRNGNDAIDNGSELFGNVTPQPQPPSGSARNGFLALAEYDKPANGGNADGLIDQLDTVYLSLRLWRDLNHNGASEPGELSSLSHAQVEAVSLDFKEARRQDRWGNTFLYRARVHGRGAGSWAYDVVFLAAPVR